MLINFRFQNCRSFLDEANLSMQATSDTTKSEINTFFASENVLPKGENELLKSSVIFGGNASGKSNIIKAFAYMVNVVRLSSAQIPIVSGNEHYAFNFEANKVPSVYEVEIIQNSVYYKYGFELLQGKVLKEWLYKREERLTKVFERSGSKLDIMGVSAQAINLIKIPDATLFLSSGNNFNLPINRYLSDVMVWFANVLIVFENAANSLDIYTIENGKYKEKALEILKRADIGITDFTVVKDKVASVTNPQDVLNLNTQIQINPTLLSGQFKAENESLYHIDVRTDFNVYDNDNNVVGTKNVMLFKENGFNSEGTVRLLCYMGWILAALDQGRTIFIDEIDSKLHFLVADYIIGMFNSIEDNPKNAQLICTAHNVLLMDDGMRRDQIYFTSKDSQGRSTLVSLADFNGVRKNDLFSKRYLAGFYASLPDLSTIE
ncbi:MAG: ATP-binding protein [Clostridia bacterium]|nr:ATP-binding protein [Clostridia bacterium]